ncbi:MAG: histone H1 [Rhodobacteraceae bacterium]|nr:histone H1 [Paracoccaceae bacterium]
MPKGPKGQKRPADVIGNAVKIAQIATGEVEDDGKDSAARALGSKGGKARALKLGEKERSKIAAKAAAARWGRQRS